MLCIKNSLIRVPTAFTKRSVLCIGAKLYDPLGLISPVFVKVKILFQDLCLDKRDWDEGLPDPLKSRWMQYVNQLKEVKNISVPRYVFSPQTDNFKNAFLHGFSDSSQKVYSAVVYLQVELRSGFLSRVITSKTR